jgi:hypothetical protein
VNYGKVDSALAAALDTVGDRAVRQLPVFVHLRASPTPRERGVLSRLGVAAGPATRQIFTATLSAQQVEELSDQEWVRQLRLSQPLDLLGGQ